MNGEDLNDCNKLLHKARSVEVSDTTMMSEAEKAGNKKFLKLKRQRACSSKLVAKS